MELEEIKGIGKKTAEKLREAGYSSVKDIANATIEDLTSVEGIGQKLATKIKTEAEKLVHEEIEKEEPEKEEVEEIKEEEIVEEKEFEEKKIKIIPSLTDEEIRLLKLKNRMKIKKPEFRRYESHKKKKLDDSWRRPRGRHNKLRKGIKGKGAVVRVGYGSPKPVRGRHPSGFEEYLIYNPEELEGLDPSRHAVRIARTVGLKKRLEIESQAEERGFKILNPARVS